MDKQQCKVPKCNRKSALIYLGKGVCDYHWCLWAEDTKKLRRMLKIKNDVEERQPTVEGGKQTLERFTNQSTE